MNAQPDVSCLRHWRANILDVVSHLGPEDKAKLDEQLGHAKGILQLAKLHDNGWPLVAMTMAVLDAVIEDKVT